MDLPAELAHLNPDPALQEWMSDMLDQRQRTRPRSRRRTSRSGTDTGIAHHRRIRFGNKSEAFSPEQRELFQETWDTDLGAIEAEVDAQSEALTANRPKRARAAASRCPSICRASNIVTSPTLHLRRVRQGP